MWNRMVDSELAAWKEVAALRADGHKATDPIRITYNRREVWQYSSDKGLKNPA